MQNSKGKAAYNTGLAKVAVQCSADALVFNQSLVLRINFCGENRHLRQARNRWHQALKDNTHDKRHQQKFRYLTTIWHIYFLQNKQPAKNKRAILSVVLQQQDLTL